MKIYYNGLRDGISNVVDNLMGNRSQVVRKAYSLASYFQMFNIDIDDSDIIAANNKPIFINNMIPEKLYQEIEKLEDCNAELLHEITDMDDIGLFCRNPGNHIAPAYDVLINEGIDNRLKEVIRYSKINKNKDFYEAQIILLYSLKKKIIRYSQKAKEKYVDTGEKYENLKKISESCEWISCNKPRDFHEAVQLLMLLHESVVQEAGSGSISFGRLDQYLYPYYKKDIKAGKLTNNQAQDIITDLWRRISEYPQSWQNVTIGGRDAEGNDMSNELTIMCMNASLDVRADQPQLSLRVHKNMNDEVWEKAIELIRTGMGFPELYNDDVAIMSKINAGCSKEDALNYSIVGCVELSISGKEYAHTEGARLNWAKLIELMLNDGVCNVTGKKYNLSCKKKLDEISSFDEFLEWYKLEFKYVIEKVCEFIDEASGEFPKNWSVPFATGLMEECVKRAKDVTDCGTKYNNLCMVCVGFASTVDSLIAIKHVVFEDKKVTLSELSEILNGNFENNDKFISYVKGCPKYGNDIDEVDNLASELVDYYIEILQNYKLKYRDGVIQPGFYTSYFHSDFGKLTGATPDGRKNGMPLSSSMSAMSGMDKNGPTALINSANKIKMDKISNGMVLDMKFDKVFLATETHREALKTLVQVYFENGGMEVQFNVVDKDTLIDAQKNPQNYQNLIVRVSGFSAYFCSLDKELQDEIINRTTMESV